MLKRIVYIGNPFRLHLKDQQLVLQSPDEDVKDKTIPFEDIGVLMIDHPRISLTQSVMQSCGLHNIALIICNPKHHPVSLMLHLDTHSIQTELFRFQIEATQPLKKQLWKQTIAHKINNQAALLKKRGASYEFLYKLATTVKSGDSGNAEAVASRYYWQRLFDDRFRRARFGDGPNAALNYGYAILRAAVARALCGSGLLPTLGIHHHNRYNAYCLADDIMEPYRPFVDEAVLEIEEDINEDGLSKAHKAHLLAVMNRDVTFPKVKRPLMLGISQTTASLARCFEGKTRKIEYPVLL